MGLFNAAVEWRRKVDNIKLRGSLRTARLRKKRSAHLEELYVKYRDEIFIKRCGIPYMEWWKDNQPRWRNTR